MEKKTLPRWYVCARPFATALPFVLAACSADVAETPDEDEIVGESQAAVTATGLGIDTVLEAPQYLAVRKTNTALVNQGARTACVTDAGIQYPTAAPFYGNSQTCVIMNSSIVDAVPDRGQRVEVLRAGFREVRSRVGFNAGGGRQLATEVIIDTLGAEPAKLKTYLEDVVAAARAESMPLLVAFDTVDWASARQDLWLDETNFELGGPDAAHVEPARIAWRNWGSQIRVGTPPPNLHSAAFRQANAAVLALLLPVLRNYARSLPPDAQHLFAGIVLGTEISVGVNHYIYPNGNAYINQPSTCDPGLPLAAGCPGGPVTCPNGQTNSYNRWQCPPDFASGGLSGHMWQLGFRAASEMGLPLGPNGTMTRQALDAIVTDYLSFLNHQVRVVNDMPTHKIFSHAGGTWGGAQGPHSLGVARFGSMIPGWSLYGSQASNPAALLDPEVATPVHVALPWATPEWLPFGAGASETSWRNAFRATANYHNNRLVSVGNWESISNDANARNALRTVLGDVNAGAASSCVVTPRVVLGMAKLSDGVALRLSAGAPGTASYLVGSTGSGINDDGLLGPINLVNTAVTGKTSQLVAAQAAPSFLQVVTDGCAGVDGNARRVYSPVYTVDSAVPSSAKSYVSGYPRVYARSQSSGSVTVAWELDPTLPAGTAVYFNIATSPSFSPIDVHNERVDGYHTSTRGGLQPGTTYYARVVHPDPNVGVAYSNTLAFTVANP
ncbi:hypothetical protein [Polyangium sp. 6x1]|uniref:hypothetical protein n=1 Tax=Polyangium sp. 6x1 TaxID=3042689 RepID=UPI002482F257|nr:hypothetical protein [Polyangium sp. 6x1]MDI1446870.1 hypothetical protein [Polyangium sp. 6x1]